MKPTSSYKIRPTRAEMQQLPRFAGLGLHKITVLTNAADIALARVHLSQCEVLGFDTESKPTFQVGEQSSGPHLVQLASS